jgi:hypothetical protein
LIVGEGVIEHVVKAIAHRLGKAGDFVFSDGEGRLGSGAGLAGTSLEAADEVLGIISL